jgi:hypothetical protein
LPINAEGTGANAVATTVTQLVASTNDPSNPRVMLALNNTLIALGADTAGVGVGADSAGVGSDGAGV